MIFAGGPRMLTPDRAAEGSGDTFVGRVIDSRYRNFKFSHVDVVADND